MEALKHDLIYLEVMRYHVFEERRTKNKASLHSSEACITIIITSSYLLLLLYYCLLEFKNCSNQTSDGQ